MRKFNVSWVMLLLMVLSVLASFGFGRLAFGAIYPFIFRSLE
jgi:hypothetical protein